MDILRCIIVDDEPLPLELLTDYIGKTPFLELAGAYTNPMEALAAAQASQIDLVFLDIQMPELNGLQFIPLLREKSRVILTTAYRHFALDGYDLNVIDYLLKPIPFDRFLKAATKALHTARPVALPDAPSDITTNATYLFVKSDYKLQKVDMEDILFIEGLKEYIAIHTTRGKVVTLQNVKKMEAILPAANFIRVHKSFIVAIDKIDTIERSRIYVKDAVIPIGDLYRDAFFSAIQRNNIS